MASTSKCQYCDSTISSSDKQCPSCGAPNPNYVAETTRSITKPKTIEELKTYCAERGMPLLRMRFFIDEDYKQPRAFGIYRDGDRFVVYKNKGDGSRAIRYQGPDEAYAVNELYMKLLAECHNRGIYPDGKPEGIDRSGGNGANKKQSKRLVFIIAGVLLYIFLFVFFPSSCLPTPAASTATTGFMISTTARYGICTATIGTIPMKARRAATAGTEAPSRR
ncbi:MAG: hypothetical protein IJM18_00560 [Clostridia bacterium]|nr:hypothetical protein [Clostridia bacterium]